MKLTRHAVLSTAATALLAVAAAATATAAASSPARTAAPPEPGVIKVIATIPVGGGPRAVAVNPKTNTVYVTNTDDGTVSVLVSCRGAAGHGSAAHCR